jgi:hypothetical protein
MLLLRSIGLRHIERNPIIVLQLYGTSRRDLLMGRGEEQLVNGGSTATVKPGSDRLG